jgi:hypothetical protein
MKGIKSAAMKLAKHFDRTGVILITLLIRYGD